MLQEAWGAKDCKQQAQLAIGWAATAARKSRLAWLLLKFTGTYALAYLIR